MFLSRIPKSAPVCAAVVLAWAAGAGSAAAGGTSTAPAVAPAPPATIVEGKAPEVSTVGTTPAVLTVAERAKLAHLTQMAEARARAQAQATPVRSIAREFLSPVPAVETRLPSMGPRDRTKPIPATAEVGKGDGR